MSFDTGLMNMANYLGNVILPISAGLLICLGLYSYAHQQGLTRYIQGALACLMISGFVRMAEHLASQGSGAGQYEAALLGLVNWVANVVMPLYAAWALVKFTLAWSGIMERTNIGMNYSRYLVVAIGCLSVSGIVRLLEWFVTQGSGGLH
jgi:hypothetical protein